MVSDGFVVIVVDSYLTPFILILIIMLSLVVWVDLEETRAFLDSSEVPCVACP